MPKDTLVHIEKTIMPSFGQGEMRNLIVTATGLIGDLPKTVGTGCGKRRKLAQTSRRPEAVTCPLCRAWAREDALKWADMAQAALGHLTPEDERYDAISAEAQQQRERAEAFR